MNNQLEIKKIYLFCMGLVFTKICFCQVGDTNKNRIMAVTHISNTLNETKKNNFGVEVVAAILPKAKIKRQSGNYTLHSHIQSSYDVGANYLHQFNNNSIFLTGLHLVVGKRNFFANIPSADINNWTGRNIIESKELWT